MKLFISRRALLSSLAVCATGAVVGRRAAGGTETSKLEVGDPAAAAVGYVEDAERADSKRFPGYVKGSVCENCALLEGKAGAPYRPCTLFGGKLVAVKGWCSGWAAEM